MEFISQVQFLLYFFYYIFAIFITFYIPGAVLLRNIKITGFQKFVLGTIVGLSLWALQGFIFGFLQIRFFTYGYLAAFFICWMYRLIKGKQRFKFSKLSFHLSYANYLLKPHRGSRA